MGKKLFFPKAKGFSLLELLVIVAIVGLMASMAFSYFSGTPRERLKSAARDLVLALKSAHISAMEKSETWTVEFDTDGSGKYSIKDGSGNERIVKKIADYTGISYGSNHGKTGDDQGADSVNDGVTIKENKISFGSDGTCVSQGTVYLKNTEDTMAVGIASAAGQIVTKVNFGSDWQ